jgi:hypothetical protein
MAMHIINCSVDAPDMQLNAIAESDSHNDMESIVEIVLEKVLEIENAIPEHDESDDEGKGTNEFKKDYKLFAFLPLKNISSEKMANPHLEHVSFSYCFEEQYISDDLTPPPKI